MKKQIVNCYFALAAIHVTITIGFALVFGINHPFFSHYEINKVIGVIIASIATAIPLYAIAGFLFVIAKEHKKYLLKAAVIASLIFTATLSVLWAISYLLSTNGFSQTTWLIYILSNYPSAIIMNRIINLPDLRSPLMLLTATSPAIGFVFGVFIRTINENTSKAGK
ncbi:MAG: hypothetical protein CVU94_06480 [Firmicutes bacterium HGW-Firmicutes-19]|jgi:hypothetical protein|nr:MAG: hypothetical protein CVU94_06480 [Firmicutes bacterium HGW-Firmicutes-19]